VGIFGAAFLAAKAVVSNRPFCETCNQWTRAEADLISVSASDPAAVKQMLLDHRFNDLASVGGGKRDHWIALAYHGCDNCKQFNTLTATEVTTTVDKKGRESQKKKVLVNRMIASDEEIELIRSLRPKPAMTMSAPVLGIGAPPPSTIAPPPAQSPATATLAKPPADSDIGVS
jgi:hypothetical protein